MGTTAAYKSRKALLLAAFCTTLLLLITALARNSEFGRSRGRSLTTVVPSAGDTNWRPWLQASNIQVSAIAFYGRRRYVRILDKYIKQNLVSAGGVLEEVATQLVCKLLHMGCMLYGHWV